MQRLAAIGALVGGVVSEMTGGKFENGAMTATISWAFNELGGEQNVYDSQRRVAVEAKLRMALEASSHNELRVTANLINVYADEFLSQGYQSQQEYLELIEDIHSQVYNDKKVMWRNNSLYADNFTQVEHYTTGYLFTLRFGDAGYAMSLIGQAGYQLVKAMGFFGSSSPPSWGQLNAGHNGAGRARYGLPYKID